MYVSALCTIKSKIHFDLSFKGKETDKGRKIVRGKSTDTKRFLEIFRYGDYLRRFRFNIRQDQINTRKTPIGNTVGSSKLGFFVIQ